MAKISAVTLSKIQLDIHLSLKINSSDVYFSLPFEIVNVSKNGTVTRCNLIVCFFFDVHFVVFLLIIDERVGVYKVTVVRPSDADILLKDNKYIIS